MGGKKHQSMNIGGLQNNKFNNNFGNYMKNGYLRVAVYPVYPLLKQLIVPKYADESFKYTDKSFKYKVLNGFLVSYKSQRYDVFRKSCKCVECGVVGTILAMERSSGSNEEVYHFNLYAIKDGKEILMTKDHIKPKSLGGTDTLDNYQTMCASCNSKKGNKWEQ